MASCHDSHVFTCEVDEDGIVEIPAQFHTEFKEEVPPSGANVTIQESFHPGPDVDLSYIPDVFTIARKDDSHVILYYASHSLEADLEKLMEASCCLFVKESLKSKTNNKSRLFYAVKDYKFGQYLNYSRTYQSYGCVHGRNKKPKNSPEPDKKKRKTQYVSKKQGCPAVMHVNKIEVFPGYPTKHLSVRDSRKLTKQFNSDLNKGMYIESKMIYKIKFPYRELHSHILSPDEITIKNCGEKLRNVINQWVEDGINTAPAIRRMALEYVQNDIEVNEMIIPSIIPSKNAIQHLLKKKSQHAYESNDDIYAVKNKLIEYSQTRHQFTYYFEESPNFILGFQDEYMKYLLERFGESVIIDTTYFLQKKKLALFVFAVKTDCNYMPIAYFFLEEAKKNAVTHAIQIINNWNPAWNPQYIFIDYLLNEVNSIKAVFPNVAIKICLWHIMRRWRLRLAKGDIPLTREEHTRTLSLLSNIAFALNYETQQKNIQVLQHSVMYHNYPNLRYYLDTYYLSKVEYWSYNPLDRDARCMRKTSPLESLNASLKRELDASSDKTLVNILVTILDFYFLALTDKYLAENENKKVKTEYCIVDDHPLQYY